MRPNLETVFKIVANQIRLKNLNCRRFCILKICNKNSYSKNMIASLLLCNVSSAKSVNKKIKKLMQTLIKGRLRIQSRIRSKIPNSEPQQSLSYCQTCLLYKIPPHLFTSLEIPVKVQWTSVEYQQKCYGEHFLNFEFS